MGKKVKKKIRNAHKEKKDSHGTTQVHSNTPVEVVGEGVLEVKGRTPCTHIEKSIDLDKIIGKIGSKDISSCQDCREGSSDRKGRSKHGKKGGGAVGKKKESKYVWACLQCGHFSCGGVGLPNTPQSHAIRHWKQSRHPCVIQLQNPNLCWCFSCDSLIPVGKSEQDDGVQNNVLLDVVKLIKGGHSEGPSIDVEDVWFGSGNVGGGTRNGTTESLVSDRNGGYVVRGLANLGNTCFFNSVMQNLLAMDQLRDYFTKLDHSVGPLTMALQKLFNEASFEADSRYGISPRNLFGCICSRSPQFRGYQQQDSHELLRCLLDGLCTEELNVRKSAGSSKENGSTSNLGPTFVDAIFGGQLSSTVSCMKCKHSSVVYEPFLDLSLPVPTKKSPSKKVPLLSRSRKAKLPLKYEARKGGKIRGKGKADSAPLLVPSATGSSKTINSSCLTSASLPLEVEKVDSFDDCWLDFLVPDTTSTALDSVSQNHDILPIQVSESKHISHDDDMLQNSLESQSQVFSQSTEPKENSELSKRNSSENDLPLLQGSEVLFLPSKEESSTTGEMMSKDCGASSSALGQEQESDFDGFGGLFDEPEMTSVPNLDEKNSQEFEVTQTGLLAGNNSESDPDEVDDTDAPVSINSCLAYFTKSELLSKEAWHCENCSKALQGQQVYFRENQSKTTVKQKLNGVQLRSHSDPLDGDLLNSTAESCSLENGYPESDLGSSIQSDENLLQSRFTPQEVSPFMADCNSSNQGSFVDQDSGSGSVDDSDSIGSNVNQVHCAVSQSKVKALESNDGDEVDGKSVKVMRDATKRILINKLPQILTIHLKRFSQDARGRLSKLSGHVTFLDKIDLSSYMNPRSNEQNECEYQLIGVVEHSGTMRGGHYVAYVRGGKRKGKTEQDNEEHTWFYASDAYVREVSVTEVFRSEAYILFYKKSIKD